MLLKIQGHDVFSTEIFYREKLLLSLCMWEIPALISIVFHMESTTLKHNNI